jgi:RsiW-degrading membrane proteinase PrsW (M82 family)
MDNYMSCAVIVTIMILCTLGVLLVNDFMHKRIKNTTIKFMAVVFVTGVFSTLFPFFTWGLVFGLPSVIVNTALLAIFYRNKL